MFVTVTLNKKAVKKIIIALLAGLFAILIAIYCRGHESISTAANTSSDKKFIKWLEFNASYEALYDSMQCDIQTNTDEYPVSQVDILAYLASKYGNDFSRYSKKDVDAFMLRIKNGESIEDICTSKYFDYYRQAYGAVIGNFLNDRKDGGYGLNVYSPIAYGFDWNHYKDFGASRSYGFKRKHLGNDILGSIGTPIIAVEDGTVEALGWNRYGGWRIGIRSFDKKRYYYYAHLRKGHPYVKTLKEGDTVNAGQVIGYLGMTGYSTKENVNNINIPHLHFGMQIIFDESQKDGNGEIWIDVYNIVELLKQNSSKVIKNTQTGEYEVTN